MLSKQTEDKIIDTVRVKPRTIQEIATLVQKNWRTAERYVTQIAQETGLISTRTFREGTRGALKIVYWNALESAKGTAYQESLLRKIENGRRKEDFSSFDIYQFIDWKKREAFVEKEEYANDKTRYDTLFKKSKAHVLLLSGNLSWLAIPEIKQALIEATKRHVKFSIITRVDLTSQKSANELLDLNKRIGWDAVAVRHCEQPLRGVIIDDTLVCLKEVLNPNFYRENEKPEKKYMYYLIKDPEWIHWLQKVFWHLWSPSIEAKERIKVLGTIV